MNGARLQDIWVYLESSPLLWLTATLIAFQAGLWLHKKSGGHPLLNPVPIAIALLVGILAATGTDYGTFFEGAQFVHFMLGPATVALAVPLYRQFRAVRQSALGLSAAIIGGSLIAALSALGLGWVLDASHQTVMSLAPKSVTSPIAMGIAEQIGGLPSLTAVFVILTGIVGATLGTFVLDAVRVTDDKARGVAIGVAAHGIGTARAFQISEVAGAFSGLAMGLNGIATSILVPVLVHWLG